MRHGQSSAISLRYLYMLAGIKDYIRPDRMILRFIESAIGKTPSIENATALIVDTCDLFKTKYPSLTPRLLDNIIWKYQRNQ